MDAGHGQEVAPDGGDKPAARERLRRFGRDRVDKGPVPPVPAVMDRRRAIERLLEEQDG